MRSYLGTDETTVPESSPSTTMASTATTVASPSVPPTPMPSLPPTPAPTSRLLGSFYSEEDLVRWRDRAVNGPFATAGDSFINSPAEWERIHYAAVRFPDENGAGPLPGIDEPLSEAAPGDGAALRGGQFGFMMAAAFLDLVQGTNTYTAEVKGALLAQARTPGTNFSNGELFPRGSAFSGNPGATWAWAEWLKMLLLAYDYLGPNAFSAAERGELDSWFWEAAEWHRLATDERMLDPLYVERGVVPFSDTQFNTESYIFAMSTTDIYLDGPPFYVIQNMYDSHSLAQTSFVAHAGVALGVPAFITSAANCVKEYIAFHMLANGHFAGLKGSSKDSVYSGLAHGANTLANIVEIAHMLQLHGYENLDDFETRVGLNMTNGDIAVDSGVTKSIEWIFLSFLRNYMLDNATLVYPYDGEAVLSQAMHFCLSGDAETRGAVVRMYFSAAIANHYLKNPLIEQMYYSPGGNVCNYTTDNAQMLQGVLGKIPSALLQYAVKWTG